MTEQPIFVRGRLSPGGVDALRGVLRFLFGLLTRVEVRGLEHLPPEGGFIVTPNHLSYFEAPLAFSLLRGRHVTSFSADKYRGHWLFSTFLESLDTIWVERGAIPPSVMKYALQALREKSILGMAPEGTRSPTRALQKGKHGAAFLAVAANVPIVPLGVSGTEKVIEAWKHFGRAHIVLTFGKPYKLPPVPRNEREAKLEEYTTEIMCQIAALLPPEYRGVYADEPRVKELLSSK